MPSTLTLVLAGVVAYTVVALALRNAGLVPEFVRFSGPITTIHTQRGKALLDRLARPRRFWRAWGNLGVGIALVVMAGSFVAVLYSGYAAFQRPDAQPVQNPQNVLVIPGVNEFLPLSAAPEIVFGLALGLVVHEGGHGLLCRVEDIDIDSMGLALFTLIPIGAFVGPDETSQAAADRGSRVRMFAAGVTNNFAISIVAFLLLFGPVAGSIATAPGVPVGDVTDGSAAAAAGIDRGDVVTGVAGRNVTDEGDLDAALANASDRRVTVTLRGGERVTVTRRLVLTRAVTGVLEQLDVDAGDPPRIVAVNDTSVGTVAEFRRAVGDRSVAEIVTAESGTATVRVGAYVARVQPEGPLAAAGAPTEEGFVLTRVGDRRVHNMTALQGAVDRFRPGETVSVVAYVDGERRTYEVTLESGPEGSAHLGVFLVEGTSGLVVDDFGVQPYPAEQFLAIIGGDEPGIGPAALQRIALVLALPFWNLIQPGANFAFAGFTGGIGNFYTATGVLSPLGGGVLLLANLLFWTAWINIQLGWFNCIPTYPLDGGHILRAAVESVVARVPVDDRRSLTTTLTVAVSLVMIGALLVMIFGPQLLGSAP